VEKSIEGMSSTSVHRKAENRVFESRPDDEIILGLHSL
jgi:hypothetical protein